MMGESIYNELFECIWKKLSKDPGSTTFQDVDRNHQLYRCKYECNGMGLYYSKEEGIKRCEFYKPADKLYKAR